MRRVVFEISGGYRGRAVVNRENIIGFRVPDPRLVWTNILLDSGAEIPLNGMSLEEAEKVLDDFDAHSSTDRG